MITGITIENFKGIRDKVQIEFRPLTLLFGTNSAGKSTVFHALHYAREIFERQNLNADTTISGGKYIDLGGFRAFVHNHDAERVVRLGFKVDMRGRESDFDDFLDTIDEFLEFPRWTSESLDSFGKYSNAEVTVAIAWSEQHERAYIAAITIACDGERFAEIHSDPDAKRVTLTLNPTHHSLSTLASLAPDDAQAEAEGLSEKLSDVFPDPGRTCLAQCLPAFIELCEMADRQSFFLSKPPVDLLNPHDDLPFVLKDHAGLPSDLGIEEPPAPRQFAMDMIAGISRLIVLPIREVSQFISTLRYLGPLRDTPLRTYQPPRYTDPTRWASGLGAWDSMQFGTDEFVQAVSDWLGDEDKLNSGYRIDRRNFKEIDLADPLIRKLLSGRAFDDVDEYARIRLDAIPTQSRLVIVPQGSELELRPHDVGVGISQVVPVVVTALEGEKRLLAIEQPELHLHPRLQAELGDLFIEAALGPRGHVILLETHSEHLILRLLRRIRETTDGELPENKRPLQPDDVAVYFIQGTPDGVRETRLRVDKTGDFEDQWPTGFFEERAKELF